MVVPYGRGLYILEKSALNAGAEYLTIVLGIALC
jgi:hypothetical protein